MRLGLATAVLGLTLVSCGSDPFDNDCDDERAQLVRDVGQPEEIARYDSDDYHSWTYWYWRRGYSKTFVWGRNVSKDCEMSEYRFSPIRAAPR